MRYVFPLDIISYVDGRVLPKYKWYGSLKKKSNLDPVFKSFKGTKIKRNRIFST